MKIVDEERFNWAQLTARRAVQSGSKPAWGRAMKLLRKAYGLEVVK